MKGRSGSRVVAVLALLLSPWPASIAGEKPITEEDRQHWAFVPPQRPAVPKVRESGWVRNPIDAFILARLEASGLGHAPEADRATLLRRLSFDLMGLPPTPEEIDAFEHDPAPEAYEKVVDRLLASPRYGERWAQHWLDLARYADTDGFEFDQVRPDAWRYRDWVVEALNRDLPYDAFVRLQLAGDEIEPDNPAAFIATGFNRCYPDMVDLNDQGLRRQNALNDITETTGLVFLGLTIGCARCHDHKFDPIRQSDFYKLQAFFTPARFRDDYPIASAAARADYERRQAAWEGEVAALQAALIRLEAPARARLAPGLPEKITDEVVAAYQKDEARRTPREVRLVYEALARDKRLKSKDLAAALDPDQARERERLLARLEAVQKAAPPPLPRARGLDETGPEAPPTYLLRRGEYTAKGPEVPPAFPAVLTKDEAETTPPIAPTARSTGRRSALAAWLVRSDHPLTARVMVNRLWQHHFGRGIVRSPNNFGLQGDKPTHPALLDWLAAEFLARGWRLKPLHRLIMTSSAYRMSSRGHAESLAKDPANDLFWRFDMRRLTAEEIRDSLLALSGTLNLKMYGPGVYPAIPPEVMAGQSMPGKGWGRSPPEEQARRSIYIHVKRSLLVPILESFDLAETDRSSPVRFSTTQPTQALAMLNSRFLNEQAALFADRLRREAGEDLYAQVRLALRLATSRDPGEAEVRRGIELIETLASRDGLGPEAARRAFALVVLNLNEFLYLD